MPLKAVLLTVLLAGSIGRLCAQTNPAIVPTSGDTTTTFELWRTIVGGFDLEKMPVGEAESRVIQHYRATVENDLDVLQKLAPRIRHHASLADEVTFASTAQSAVNDLQQMATFVVSTQVQDPKNQQTISLYAQSLAALVSGPVEELFESSYNSLLQHAKAADQVCGGQGKRAHLKYG